MITKDQAKRLQENPKVQILETFRGIEVCYKKGKIQVWFSYGLNVEVFKNYTSAFWFIHHIYVTRLPERKKELQAQIDWAYDRLYDNQRAIPLIEQKEKELNFLNMFH